MTKQEKAAIFFLIAMLILGLVVKYYKIKTCRINPKIDVQKIIEEKQTIKINTATVQDFSGLPGIGPALAQRIVDYRNEFGSFLMLEDLKKVKGLGGKKYDKIKDYLVVD